MTNTMFYGILVFTNKSIKSFDCILPNLYPDEYSADAAIYKAESEDKISGYKYFYRKVMLYV